MMLPRFLQLSLLLLTSTEALDIILKGFECNESLPIYVKDDNLALACNGSSQCAMGTDALLTGKLQYTGVEDLGLVDNYAFVSADLEFLSLEFDVLQYLQVPMCGEYVTVEGADEEAENDGDDENENGCPGDGVYSFNLPYVLPDEQTKASWLATGWKGQGEVSFYSEANNADSLMGFCQLYFATDVTPSSETSLVGKVPVPSAMVTAAVLAAFVGFLILTCLYRMVRDFTGGKKKKEKKQLDEESCEGTAFVSMKDEI